MVLVSSPASMRSTSTLLRSGGGLACISCFIRREGIKSLIDIVDDDLEILGSLEGPWCPGCMACVGDSMIMGGGARSLVGSIEERRDSSPDVIWGE